MKISEKYNLRVSSESLSFLDVELDKDNYHFINSFYIANSDDEFCVNCNLYMKSFFKDFLIQLQDNNEEGAYKLFSHLREINNIRLGMSQNEPQGRGIGKLNAEEIFNAIKDSELFKEGVIADEVSDMMIFVKNLDKDKMSDMVANIIKLPLIQYTMEQCASLNIECVDCKVEYWNKDMYAWETKTFALPVDDKGEFILLVPRSILIQRNKYTFGDFLWKYVLTYYQEMYLRDDKDIVNHRTLKSGDDKATVSKKAVYDDMKKTILLDKDFAAKFALEHPDKFKEFKDYCSNSIKNKD
ncbi:MAG: hypothetical protein MJ227_02475 [Bacilli bacterium]|nr:hypothetical protein [Bacilli bacterium]